MKTSRFLYAGHHLTLPVFSHFAFITGVVPSLPPLQLVPFADRLQEVSLKGCDAVDDAVCAGEAAACCKEPSSQM